MKRIPNIFFFLIILFGIFLRLYNLNWGAPFYFHPDERNIASSVSQLNLFSNMNPHFFAYGSFPIYLYYATGLLENIANQKSLQTLTEVTFGQAILISRLYSSILSILLLFLLYKVFYYLSGVKSKFFLAVCATSVGFIQFAHFGTFELWISFLSLLIFYILILYKKNDDKRCLFFLSLLTGILISVKVSSIIFLPLVVFFVSYFVILQPERKKYKLSQIIKKALYLIFISIVFYLITSPFSLLDYESFVSSLKYESAVALGDLPVFYTGSFYNTLPVLYHFLFVLPFLANPLITLLLIPSFVFVAIKSLKEKNIYYFTLLLFFVFSFFSQAFLFVKWTRYAVSSLPFIYLIVFIGFYEFTKLLKKRSKIQYKIFMLSSSSLFCAVSIFYSIAFFLTVLAKDDTRVTAAIFANKTLSKNSEIISEVYDLGIVPFNQYFSRIKLFNFYDIDELPEKTLELEKQLKNTDVIILPSQRILHARLSNKNNFPNGHAFYKNLLDEKSGFKLIYKTPCDFFCKTLFLGDPIFNVELTANAFDRPTVFIFKRNN